MSRGSRIVIFFSKEDKKICNSCMKRSLVLLIIREM